MRVLYQFPLSHFCEKARWLLDHKELDYVAHNVMPGVHFAFAQLKTAQADLPILQDHKRWIAQATEIALYLDEQYPEHSLLRKDQLRTQTLSIDQIANELGLHIRRWALGHALNHNNDALDIIMGEQGYLRQFQTFTRPILKTLLIQNYGLKKDKMVQAKQRLDEIVAILNQKLIDNSARYFVGDRLGLADIAVCSMLAPILEIAGTPWEKENNQLRADELQQYKLFLLDLPLGQYVQRIYDTERNARVDWRGV